jgi:hypothetical protein
MKNPCYILSDQSGYTYIFKVLSDSRVEVSDVEPLTDSGCDFAGSFVYDIEVARQKWRRLIRRGFRIQD